ncbi:uncharacterized protein LOC108106835 [Drosophila eugracilis]|uniref:uncharacterized protein LOC108106835 n=1 Tax=Drosophila eugracilis TaxID=29029 RepID=UPI001BDA3F2A|nr:uncharacterized protein LOC108106835 [Drosophila eugracilis]
MDSSACSNSISSSLADGNSGTGSEMSGSNGEGSERDVCQIDCCDQEDDTRPPYVRVMPEDRRYGVVVTNDEDPCDCDFNCFLIFLVERFEQSDEVGSLAFSECTSIEPFGCNLLIVCRDDCTKDWIIRETRTVCPPFKCTTFIRHFELVRVSFVIPMVVHKRLCRIFNIFERQNAGLGTGKWCVVGNSELDPDSEDYHSKVVYEGAQNIEITCYIDEDSAEYIKKRCSMIRFLVWHLFVDFCPKK